MVVMACACGIRRKWKAGRDIPEGDIECVCGQVMRPAGAEQVTTEEANEIELLEEPPAGDSVDGDGDTIGGDVREGVLTFSNLEDAYAAAVASGPPPDALRLDFPVLYDQRESLLCVLTVAEFMNRSSALARAVQDVKSEQDHQTEQKAKMKSILTEFEGERDRLTMAVSRKAEPRDVRILGKPDYDAGLLRFYRTDTGEEIRSRSLTESERQRPLFAKGD